MLLVVCAFALLVVCASALLVVCASALLVVCASVLLIVLQCIARCVFFPLVVVCASALQFHVCLCIASYAFLQCSCVCGSGVTQNDHIQETVREENIASIVQLFISWLPTPEYFQNQHLN